VFRHMHMVVPVEVGLKEVLRTVLPRVGGHQGRWSTARSHQRAEGETDRVQGRVLRHVDTWCGSRGLGSPMKTPAERPVR
jgi:hypothetical protein